MTTKGAATRVRLLQAAAELIEEGGYAAASVTAIAERAGMATGALYRHFPSKADLVVELFRYVAGQELDAMLAAAAEHQVLTDRLQAVLTTYATRALAHRRLTWALVYEPVDPLVDAERLAHRRTFCVQMAELIREAIRAGEMPAQDPDLAAAAIVGAMAESLVGPISPLSSGQVAEEQTIGGIVAFCRRAVGIPVD